MRCAQLKKIIKPEFWISNINQHKDIGLLDLRLRVRAGKSLNLLDEKHYKYTIEQLRKSAESGSIKSRCNDIKVREAKPQAAPIMVQEIEKKPRMLRPIRNHGIDVGIPHYDELDFGNEDETKQAEEKMAEETAEAAVFDHPPALAVDKRFAKKNDDE